MATKPYMGERPPPSMNVTACARCRRTICECGYADELAARDARIAELESTLAMTRNSMHDNIGARDKYIADLERERDALRAEVRRFAVQPYSGYRELGMHMRCRACERHVQIGNEEHADGCPAAPLDNGSSATASPPDQD